MIELQLDRVANFAREIAMKAADISSAQFGRVEASRKSDHSVVTETDLLIQNLLLESIAKQFPDHAVVSEEAIVTPSSLPPAERSRYCWVIDPLDGTRNYAVRFPFFATSIALLDRGLPVVGVVFEHNLRHMYHAIRGHGAFLNDRKVVVADPPEYSDVLIGFASTKDAPTVSVIQHWMGVPGFILRNLGATAVHMAMVAAGELAAAFCLQGKIWDIAAGALMIEEAGGRVTDLAGEAMTRFDLKMDSQENVPFLAASAPWHARLLSSIQGPARG